MSLSKFSSFVLCLLIAVSTPLTISAATQSDKYKAAPYNDKTAQPEGNIVRLLSTGTGDRSLSVTVDGFGAFGIDTGFGTATFDPPGSIPASTTVYSSGIYFSPAQAFLASAGLNGLNPPSFTSSDESTATSTFTITGYGVVLTQTVRRTENGSTLTQTYDITNLQSQSRSFEVIRFVDGDLGFDSSITDFGNASSDGRTLSEFDAGDDPTSPSTYVGITDSGGSPSGFTIQEYPYASVIEEFGEIPNVHNGAIAHDEDGDRVTDFGYDVTLSLASVFNVGANQTVSYTSTTRFGNQTLVPRATLMWDPPDANSPLDEPPPQHLISVPIGSGALDPPLAPPAPQATRAEVTGYTVYSSSSSPVVPSQDTFFMSVPATSTTAAVPTGSGGSFFVVSANYPTGESGPSNEASADVPAATLNSVVVKGTKIVAKGSAFTSVVTVFVDGIPFVSAPKIKGTTKVTQKGTLITGQTIPAYIASRGGTVLIQFRNSNGGIASRRYPN